MDILIRPIVTEKITGQTEKFNRYGFIASKKANKAQIKQAVESLYNVSVASVNTIVYSGKKKSRFTKKGNIDGRTNAYKKAIVTLKDGDSIDFYSNI